MVKTKKVLIVAVVIVIILSFVAISFAAWSVLSSDGNLSINIGSSVNVYAEVDDIAEKQILVPKGAIKAENYKYELVYTATIGYRSGKDVQNPIKLTSITDSNGNAIIDNSGKATSIYDVKVINLDVPIETVTKDVYMRPTDIFDLSDNKAKLKIIVSFVVSDDSTVNDAISDAAGKSLGITINIAADTTEIGTTTPYLKASMTKDTKTLVPEGALLVGDNTTTTLRHTVSLQATDASIGSVVNLEKLAIGIESIYVIKVKQNGSYIADGESITLTNGSAIVEIEVSFISLVINGSPTAEQQILIDKMIAQAGKTPLMQIVFSVPRATN